MESAKRSYMACKNGNNCKYNDLGKCRFSHDNDNCSDSAALSGVRKQACRNGNDCKFKDLGKCVFSHDNNDCSENAALSVVMTACRNGNRCKFKDLGKCLYSHEEEEDIKSTPNLKLVTRNYEGSLLRNNNDYELYAVDSDDSSTNNYYFKSGTDEDHESSADGDECVNINQIDNKIAPGDPWYASLMCKCPTYLPYIPTSPIELKMKILQKLDFETLIKLNLPIAVFRQVVHITKHSESDTSWIPDYVARKNCGIIYIPENSKFSLTNQSYEDAYFDSEEICRHGMISYTMGEIVSVAEPGFYKVRILKNGFDLVKVGYHFISSQCGPEKCFAEELERNWACSYISRGFEIKTHWRCDLAPGSFSPEQSWKLLINPKKFNSPAFFISFAEEHWKSSWDFEEARPYSVDEVAQKDYKGAQRKDRLSLDIIKTETGKVNGYKIGGEALAAYEPIDDVHSDEGWYEFSITRYKYKGMDKEIGFIITGSQNDYGMPSGFDEDRKAFPDQKYFKRKVRKRVHLRR